MNNTNRIWRIKQSAEPKTLDIYIYGYVEGDSEDATTGEKIKSKTSADYFKEELEKHPDVTNINLYVNSWGGSVYEGTAIRTQLKRHPAYVTGYVDGFACSIASYILTACDKVVMPRNTMQFIHNIWSVTVGDARDHRKTADDLDQMMKANRQAYLEKSNGKLTEKKLIELLDAETWLTADECKAYGLCDVILSKDADLSQAKQMLQKVKKNYEQGLRQSSRR
jgi:ATP-dependent protease ClpP protease subunit